MKRSWSDIRGLPVSIPSEGRTVGVVEDFYYKLDTSSVYALLVKSGVHGYRLLTSNALRSVERDAVTIASEMMLIEESNSGHITVLPRGSALVGQEVKSESGKSLGKVREVVLDTVPPLALRIAEFVLDDGKTLSAVEVTAQSGDVIFVLDRAANRLR